MAGYALVGARFYCVVFADRAGVRRIISHLRAGYGGVRPAASCGPSARSGQRPTPSMRADPDVLEKLRAKTPGG